MKLRLRVTPKSRADAITGARPDGAILVRVRAAPQREYQQRHKLRGAQHAYHETRMRQLEYLIGYRHVRDHAAKH